MTLAYSCDFLLIIVALSKINSTIQQDFNWTGCNTELEDVLKGSRMHGSKWKQAEALALGLCIPTTKTFCITMQLIFHRETHHPTTFLAACAFFHPASLVSPSLHSSSLMPLTWLSPFRLTAVFADVPFTYQAVFVLGSNTPAFSWVQL